MDSILRNKIEKSYPLYRSEGNDVQRTLFFKIEKNEILPGQFFMLNYKGCQKPFSVSFYDFDTVGFTIEARGECSKSMMEAEQNEYFGLTGPLGNGFNIEDDHKFLIIGGGIGTAPLLFLADHISKNNKLSEIFFGAKDKDRIYYADTIKRLKNCMSFIYTDDGSYGREGLVTKDLEEHLANNDYDSICICGPEKMVVKTLEMIGEREENIQICMERYMKCGLGICGSCVMDDVGLRVCEEGPVFKYEDIKESTEFGNYHRDSNGNRKEF